VGGMLILGSRLIELNGMKASDEITEEQSRQASSCALTKGDRADITNTRQMLFDIENAYNEFFRSLSSSKKD
jgi:ESCRT-I complex subunit VPS28